MSLSLHLFTHVFLSFVAGLLAWMLWPDFSFFLPMLGAVLGGVLIDLDHLFDYFRAFGPSFNLRAFLRGDQFLKANKIYVLFHGWEYLILIGAMVSFLPIESLLIPLLGGLFFGSFFHLVTDTLINDGMRARSYSFIFRWLNGFEAEKIVTSHHYSNHLQKRQDAGF